MKRYLSSILALLLVAGYLYVPVDVKADNLSDAVSALAVAGASASATGHSSSTAASVGGSSDYTYELEHFDAYKNYMCYGDGFDYPFTADDEVVTIGRLLDIKSSSNVIKDGYCSWFGTDWKETWAIGGPIRTFCVLGYNGSNFVCVYIYSADPPIGDRSYERQFTGDVVKKSSGDAYESMCTGSKNYTTLSDIISALSGTTADDVLICDVRDTSSDDDWMSVTDLYKAFNTNACHFFDQMAESTDESLLSNYDNIMDIAYRIYKASFDPSEIVGYDEFLDYVGEGSISFINDGLQTLVSRTYNVRKAIDDAAKEEIVDSLANSLPEDASSASFAAWNKAIVALLNSGDVIVPDGYKSYDNLESAASNWTDANFKFNYILALANYYDSEESGVSDFKGKSMHTMDNYSLSGAALPSEEIMQQITDVKDRTFIGADDLLEFMQTSYARAVYWKILSQYDPDNTDSYTDEIQNMFTYETAFENIRNLGKTKFICDENPDDVGAYNYVNQDAFQRYVEVLHEMYRYIDKCVPVLQELEDGEGNAEEWLKALESLQDCVEYSGSSNLKNLYDTYFAKYLTELQAQVGNLSEIGTMSDGKETLEAGDALNMFFADISEGTLTDDLLTGISYSASFVPMRTNIYDPYTIKEWDEDFLSDFHYRYGYFRKALYKVNSAYAAQELANTGLTGTMSVCTLKDLIDPAGDIVLYIDDNFYNVDDLAELMDKSYSRITNTSDGDQKADADGDGEEDGILQSWWISITEDFSELFDLDIDSQVKTGENTQYSQKLRNRVQGQKDSDYYPYASSYDTSNSSKEDSSLDNQDHIVLTSGEINNYLKMSSMKPTGNGDAIEVYDDYNVLQSYAVVSSVYRCQNLFTLANSSATQSPVFIASDTVPNSNTANQAERNEIFNWLILKNLESQTPIGYSTSLDMDAPVYMDIYGNILTESGYVVVPAACNATLFSDDYYKYAMTMGLLYTYGQDYSLEEDDVQDVLSGTLSEIFDIDEYVNVWKPKSTLFSFGGDIGGDLDLDSARVSIADDETKNLIQSAFYTYLYTNSHTGGKVVSGTAGGYNFNKFANIALEVMRGAPIESIDKDFENLNTVRTLTNAGLSAAAKLEVLDDALNGGGANTLLAIPNLAFVDGFEYICLFAFKIIMLVVILVLMFTLYRDMVGQSFSYQTLFRCVSLLVTTCLAIVTIPTLFDISYYQANKLLLQDETEYIAMLNEEKRQNGVEIGVTELTEPDTSTQLLIKLEDLNVPWYDLLQKVMLSNTAEGLDDIYAEFAEQSPISQQPDVTVMNDGVYVYVDDLFDSANINIDPDTGMLELSTDEVTTAAFYTPYYVILEALVTDVNVFNDLNNWKGYTTTLQKGGRLKSIGAIQGYFTDKSFMQSEGDCLHLHEVYSLPDEMETVDVWSDEDVALMHKCAWSCGTPDAYSRIDKISERARRFVAKNQNLLGKISDETFLKVMALDIAMYHNSIFGVESANAIEIEQLSQDDLCRLMLGTKEEATYNSTLSFGRYVYQIGGSFAVYLAAAFELIMFIIGYIKPILTLVIFITIFVSLFVFKVILRKQTSSVYGYVITTLLLCLCNFGHALSLKICLYLPSLGLTPSVCVIVCSLVQFVYVALLAGVAWTSLRDWRDLGYARYRFKASQMEVGANEMMAKFKYKLHIKGSNKEKVRVRDMIRNDGEGGTKVYDSLSARRERRKKRYGIG